MPSAEKWTVRKRSGGSSGWRGSGFAEARSRGGGLSSWSRPGDGADGEAMVASTYTVVYISPGWRLRGLGRACGCQENKVICVWGRGGFDSPALDFSLSVSLPKYKRGEKRYILCSSLISRFTLGHWFCR